MASLLELLKLGASFAPWYLVRWPKKLKHWQPQVVLTEKVAHATTLSSSKPVAEQVIDAAKVAQ